MTLRATIRLLCAATLAVALTTPATAQTTSAQTQVVADPFATREDACFRAYPTYQSGAQLLLDSATGQLWQVEYGNPHAYVPPGKKSAAAGAGRYQLSDKLDSGGTANRFDLINRDLGQYTLVDQDSGAVWELHVKSTAPERSTFRKVDDVKLPDVEGP